MLFQDTLWSFYQNCWHLKDWIKYDTSAPTTLKNNVEEDVCGYTSLEMCADLANRTKHSRLDWRPRQDAELRNHVRVFINETVTSGATQTRVEYDYFVVDGAGNQTDAIALADTAIKDWETLIVHRGGTLS
jgi:hypothetical protein